MQIDKFLVFEPWFTKLQIIVKIAFSSVSLIIFIIFTYKLRKQEKKFDEQQAIRVACFLLVMFDDPLYVINVYLPSFFFTTLNSIFTTAFFIVMLLYWVIIFEKAKDGYVDESLTIFKIIYFTLFGVVVLLGLCYSLIEVKLSPTLQFNPFESAFCVTVFSVTAVFALVYLLWIGYLLSNIYSQYKFKKFKVTFIAITNCIGILMTLVVMVLFAMTPLNLKGEMLI